MRADAKLRKVQYRACVKQALEETGHECGLLPDKDEADFRVRPPDGGPAFNVRVLGRCRVEQKKRNDNMRYAFCEPWDSPDCAVYMFPHNELWYLFDKGVKRNARPRQWKNNCRHWKPPLPKTVRDVLVANGFVLRA